jgi:hypothetical protein
MASLTNTNTFATNTLTESLQSVNRKLQLIDEAAEIVMDTDSAVDASMRAMDRRYKTNFCAWIKNEKFVDDIAPYCKRIVTDYDVEVIARGFRWLFEGWSVNAIAGLLIKIYYEQGMTHPRFARLVDALLSSRSYDEAVDLV